MTEQQLEAIRARCEAATPGEWRYAVIHGHHLIVAPPDGPASISELGYFSLFEATGISNAADLGFVAHAREDVPALLAYIEELEADIRMHKEDRLRLRAENLRLDRELKARRA